MTRETQSKLLGEFYAEKKNILKLKGEDYANEDVLSNFKTAGANIGISAEQQCLSLIATKVARLGNLLSGKIPNNESISDSILDLSNYTDLLYCLVNEEEENLITQDDLGKIKSAFNKNKADFLKRKHAKSQPLTIGECFGKYEFFNNAPNGFDIQNNKNRAIIAESEKLHLNTEDILENESKSAKPQTKRWENVKPKGIINQIKWTDKCSDTADKIEEELRKLENSKKFHDDLKNELSKLSELSAELNNEKTECDCTEIPTEYKPTPEPITEPYEPKVGDVIVYNTLIYKWEIVYLDDNTVHLNAMGDLPITHRISRKLFLEYIKESVVKKIN